VLTHRLVVPAAGSASKGVVGRLRRHTGRRHTVRHARSRVRSTTTDTRSKPPSYHSAWPTTATTPRPPRGPGFRTRGLTLTSGSDHDTLTGWLFDGLYEHSRRRSATAYTTVSKDRTTSRPVSVTSQPLRWRALSESADWGHDAQHRLAADILQREVHQVSHRVHGDGMGFGREKLPAQGHQ